MKKINVRTAYDTNNTVIARVIPFNVDGFMCISKRTYNKLLNKRTVGGIADVLFDAPFPVFVYDEKYGIVF